MRIERELEERLEYRFGKKYCVLTGSGTTAICLLLEILGLKKHDVVLVPATCCFAPVYAVKYAGLEVDFCDVSLIDGCMTSETLSTALDSNERIKVVIGVHLFGNVLDLESIRNVCRDRGVLFIEDVCQAFGAWYQKAPCGAFGDFAVISFGHTKILNVGGGGAVLADDPEIAYAIRAKLDTMEPLDPHFFSEICETHRRKYYEIQKDCRTSPEKRFQFGYLWKGFRSAFIRKLEPRTLSQIHICIEQEDRIVKHRQRLARLYAESLKPQADIKILSPQAGSVPWRFNCLLKNIDVPSFCDFIRKEGFDISSWYPNLVNHFLWQKSKTLPNAETLEKEIVNLWVDESKDASYVLDLCSVMKNNLSRFSC